MEVKLGVGILFTISLALSSNRVGWFLVVMVQIESGNLENPESPDWR
jgi:hypothetical protein